MHAPSFKYAKLFCYLNSPAPESTEPAAPLALFSGSNFLKNALFDTMRALVVVLGIGFSS
jgi:hypothetical protein